MATSDLTTEPWTRIFKLIPVGTPVEDVQAAADRYNGTSDLNAAAADLWEEAAQRIDLDATPGVVSGTNQDKIQSISQDGITVQYARNAVDYSHSQRLAQYTAYMAKVKYFRSRKKVATIALHKSEDDQNVWLGRDHFLTDRIIPISTW